MLYEAIVSYPIWNQFKNDTLGRKWGRNNSDLLTILQPYVLEDSCMQLVFLICLAHWFNNCWVILLSWTLSKAVVMEQYARKTGFFFIMSWIMMWWYCGPTIFFVLARITPHHQVPSMKHDFAVHACTAMQYSFKEHLRKSIAL